MENGIKYRTTAAINKRDNIQYIYYKYYVNKCISINDIMYFRTYIIRVLTLKIIINETRVWVNNGLIFVYIYSA